MGEHEPESAADGRLTRRARRRRDAHADHHETEEEQDALNERTVVIDRGDGNERTVVIDRGHANENTVVIDRTRGAAPHARPDSETDPSNADTVVVRPRHSPATVDPPTADTVAAPPRRRPSETRPAIYKPRPAPVAPSRPPTVTGGAAPTRDTDAVRASVVRRDRRAGVIALIAVGIACMVSVAGLVGLVVALLS